MRRVNCYLASIVLILAVAAPVMGAREQGPSQLPPEPQAMSILKNMTDYMAQAGRFSVTIRNGYDVVQESGQKIEFGEVRKVTLSRPDRLRVEFERSNGEKGLVTFDGRDITIYSVNHNTFATTPRQGSLDMAIKHAVGELKVRMPLAVMLLSTLPGELESRVVSADYVETTTITDVPCDHIAARTAGGVDFQVWIAQGAQPLPRRIVITYKEEEGQPQFRAEFTNWNLSPDVSEALFAFTPPGGAERIQFLAELRGAAAMAAPRKGGKK